VGLGVGGTGTQVLKSGWVCSALQAARRGGAVGARVAAAPGVASAGGSGWRLPAPCQRHPGPVRRREAAAGWQQVPLPQRGGCGVPPARVLLAALPVLPAAPRLQGTAALAPEGCGDGVGPALAVRPVTWGSLLRPPFLTSMGFLALATLSTHLASGAGIISLKTAVKCLLGCFEGSPLLRSVNSEVSPVVKLKLQHAAAY